MSRQGMPRKKGIMSRHLNAGFIWVSIMAAFLCGVPTAPVFAAPQLLAAQAEVIASVASQAVETGTYTAPAGKNRVLVLTTSTYKSSLGNQADAVVSTTTLPTWNGKTFTKAEGGILLIGTTNGHGVEQFYAAIGDSTVTQTYTLTVTYQGSIDRKQAAITCLGNIDQTSPRSGVTYGAYANSGTATSGLTNVTTANLTNGPIPVDFVIVDSAALVPASSTLTLTAAAGQTNVATWLSATNRKYSTGNFHMATSANKLMNYTSNASTGRWGICAAAYKPSYSVTATAGTGGSLSGWTDGSYDNNASVSITAVPATGYHFLNWQAKTAALGVTPDNFVDVTGANTSPYVFHAGLKNDNIVQSAALDRNGHVVQATFALNTYTVTFDPGTDGTVTPGSTVVTYTSTYGAGTAGSLPTPTPVTGKNFLGWYTQINGGGTLVTNATTVTILADQTLYASWSNPVPITITADAKTKVYGDADPALTWSITAGALESGDSITGTLTRATGETVLGGPYTITQGSLAFPAKYTVTFVPAGLAITPRSLTVTDAAAVSKVYDGTVSATFTGTTLSGVVISDIVTVTPPASGAFAHAGIGTGIAVTPSGSWTLGGAAAGNYAVIQPTGFTANITQRALYVSGATASNKIYDGTTTASISSATLMGIVGADNVSLQMPAFGAFASKNVGAGIAVTASMTLTGSGAGNYTLTQPTGLTASITPKALTVSGIMSPISKTYDGTTNVSIWITALSGVVGGDSVSPPLPASGNFADKNVGTGKAVTVVVPLTGSDAGNYTLTQPTGLTGKITPKPLGVTGAVAANKTYDGTFNATITGATLTGVVAGDIVTLEPSMFGDFMSKDAGEGIAVATVLALTGSDAGNYILNTQAGLTANITVAPLTVAIVGNPTKTADGSTVATLNPSNYWIGGLVAADTITITKSNGSYDSAAAGARSVTVSLSPDDFAPGSNTLLSNYSLPTIATGFGTIVGKTVPVINAWPTASTISYGQALNASALSGGSASTSGSFAFTTPSMAPSNAGMFEADVTFTPIDGSAYATASGLVTVMVNKATPAITPPTASSIIIGQALSTSTLIGGSARNPYNWAMVAGSFAFTTPSVIPAGTGPQPVVFTPMDTASYNAPAEFSVTVAVQPAPFTVEAVSALSIRAPLEGSATFEVRAVGAIGTPYYAWHRMNAEGIWVPVYDKEEEALVISPVTNDVAGPYRCTVTDEVTSVDSPIFTLAICDTSKLAISLIGAASVSVQLGDSFTDPGATATDACAGDVTGNIVVSGDTINTAAPGTYVIRYNVGDGNGNAAAEVVRTVTVGKFYLVDAQNSAGPWDGVAWATAFRDIQSAVDAAANDGGGDVLVAAGTYTATTDPVVTMRPGVHLFGGFSGTTSSGGQRDLSKNITVFDGQNVRRCVIGANNAALDGFVVARGLASYGGGMYNDSSSPTVVNCSFTENSASQAGGMYNYSSSPAVVNCTFTGNSANYYGGGMQNSNYASPTVVNCTFTGNSTNYDGSGGNGGGMYNDYYSYPILTNCILWGDSSGWNNSEISDFSSAPSVSFSCIGGGYPGTGNINGDPGFVGVPGGGSLQLRAGSPCIDTGMASGAPGTDIRGAARPQGAGVDMGAYEGSVTPADIVTLTVQISPTDYGTAVPAAGPHLFARGEMVPLSALAAIGREFAGWSGDLSGASPYPGLLMDGNKTVTANFVAGTYALTYMAGAHGMIRGDVLQMVEYQDSGTTVEAVADPGCRFVQWSDGSTQNPRTDENVSGNISVTAIFTSVYTLAYSSGGHGTIYGTTLQTVDEGMNGARVTAAADIGYHFVRWSDGSTQNPRTDVNVTADLAVSAVFGVFRTLNYAAGAHGAIQGAATQSVDEGMDGTPVTAVADTGCHFVQWSDGLTSATRTDTNIVTSLFVTAEFAEGALVYRVSGQNNAGPWDGATWATAFQDIQSAVDAASATQGELWVALGTYVSTGDPVVTMRPGVALYGGFAGTESSRGQRDWSANVTAINGDNARRCVVGANNAVLDGFTIAHGSASQGAGMYNSSASPTVANCVFTGNSASYGAGIYNSSASPTMTNCVFTGNSANCGAGMYNSFYASPTLANCVFTGNSAGQGGGMYNNEETSPTLTNCVFTGNSADYGGGMHNYPFSSPVVTNCILWGDSAYWGAEMYNYNGQQSIASVTYSCVAGGYPGAGNIDTDPQFVNLGEDRLQLWAGSPCIDTGTEVGAPVTDIRGVTRPQGAGIDMGVYEGAVKPEDIVTLTVQVSPSGLGVTTPSEGAHSFVRGERVRLSAAVPSDWSFEGWSGDVSSPLPECWIVLDADKVVTAAFSTELLPAPTALNPNQGTPVGGTIVDIAGTGFTVAGRTRVLFGGIEALAVSAQLYDDGLHIICETPPHAAGVVDVEVVNPDGASAILPGGFTYVDLVPPLITNCGGYFIHGANARCGAVLPDFAQFVEATDDVTPAEDLIITQVPAVGTEVFLGETPVTVTVTDQAGNSSTCISILSTVDMTPPVITLVGGPVVMVDCGGTYTEPGAIATDNCVSGLPVTVGGMTVNPAVPGTYIVTYDAKDGLGNTSVRAMRTVTVTDRTAPVITLNGAASVNIECGSTYTELGATAMDACAGDLSAGVIVAGGVNTAVPGSYSMIYLVSDGRNLASATRMVTVTDTAPPVITLNGLPSVTVDCGGTYADPGATAMDACAGGLTRAIIVAGSVNTAVPGTHTVIYLVSDGRNMASAQRTVTVVDRAAPVITINGPPTLTVECGGVYNELGATATDACMGDLTGSIVVAGSVNTGLRGVYSILYLVTDGKYLAYAGRTVSVVDTTAPVILLNGLPSVTVEYGGTYVDPGATATDNCTAAVTVTVGGQTVNTAVPGTYAVSYSANDGRGNSSTMTRMVTVADTTVPVITLNGSPAVTVACGGTYTDAGATANDGYAGNVTSRITVVNPVNTSAPGVYTVRYNADDGYGNRAVEVTRTVTVTDTVKPVITLNGAASATVECGTPYVDAGARAADACKGDLTAAVVTEADVDTAVPGAYYVAYSVSDGSNTTLAVRFVTVADRTAPLITLIGLAAMTVPCGGTYAELGATASDACAGDLSAGIVRAGTVDTAVPGVYTVTYNVGDGLNSAVQAVRTVTVTAHTRLAVTSPNGGETWAQRSVQTITWDATGVTGLVAVLLNENGTDTQWLGQAAASAGQMSWTVPATLTPGSGYRIHMVSGDNNAIEDLSDNPFTLVSGTSPLTVISPNGGETWKQGETHLVTWDQTGVTGNVSVYLNVNGADTDWLGAASASAGQMLWTVPAWVPAGMVYKILVISADNNAVEDRSENPFTITVGATLGVSAPNGWETWTQGESRLITWNQIGVTGSVSVYLEDNGVVTQWLGAAPASDGQLAWTLPAWVTPGGAYKVLVISADNNAVEDLSDGTFTIASGVSPLTLISPNGGELWIQGGTGTVTWSQTGVTGAVAVLLNDNGTDTAWMGEVAASAGQFSWTIPSWVSPGSAYKIHVISGDNNAIEDLSDGTFSIIAPPLTLISPNGGESWAQGETHSITWNQTGLTGAVAVLLNVDGADTAWLGAAASGQFSWTVPATLTPGSNYRIHLIYGDENRFADLSDGTFTIAVPGDLPTLAVTSPNGGETWTVGQSYSVTWTETNVTGAVAVLLNVDSVDTVWLGAAAASSEQFSWTVPSWVTPASTCKIHLISGDNNAIGDLSDGTFTLTP